jgi:hypothetical protein
VESGGIGTCLVGDLKKKLRRQSLLLKRTLFEGGEVGGGIYRFALLKARRKRERRTLA